MKKETYEEIKTLRKKHGRSFNKLYKVRKNYPHGKKSDCVITIEKRR